MPVKRFDEAPYYKCEYCQNYWNSSCDGTEVGDIKTCTAYKVTREGSWVKTIDEFKEAIAEIYFLKVMCFVACVLGLIGIFY